ncbi:ORF6N domain-containing protein [Sodalis glossinidius]
MAQGYGTDINNIQQNYKRNQERFIEGKHLFKIDGEELKEFRSKK